MKTVLASCLFLVFLSTGYLEPSSAEEIKVVWMDDHPDNARGYRKKSKFRALLYKSKGTLAAFLANPFTETKFDGKAIVFDPGTRFAVFPKILESGNSKNRLALSETGIWVFAKTSALISVTPKSQEFSEGRSLLEGVKRFLPLKNSGKYLTSSRGCNSSVTQTRTLANSLEAKLEFGIAEFTYGGSLEKEISEQYEKGRNVTHQAYGLERTDQFIEVINEQVCGSSKSDKGRHYYDVYLNGQLLGSVAPDTFTAAKYGIDTVSGRAKIVCREQRDSYHSYLANELDVPAEWLQVVSSLTARWAKGFVDFENC